MQPLCCDVAAHFKAAFSGCPQRIVPPRSVDLSHVSNGCVGVQIDLVKGMMDCLYAECKPCITDCVIAELEKLGQRYRVALKVAKVCSLDVLATPRVCRCSLLPRQTAHNPS